MHIPRAIPLVILGLLLGVLLIPNFYKQSSLEVTLNDLQAQHVLNVRKQIDACLRDRMECKDAFVLLKDGSILRVVYTAAREYEITFEMLQVWSGHDAHLLKIERIVPRDAPDVEFAPLTLGYFRQN